MEENSVENNDCEICIEAKGLWKVFGKRADEIMGSDLRNASKDTILEKTGCVVAVRNVSFTVKKGEFFVIMGLSGSGKSTLIRMLLRLIDSTSGSILVDGEDVLKFNKKKLRDFRRHTTGMVFQYFGLLPHRSVLDNVAYGLKVQGVSKEKRYAKAREAIETVGLKGWEDYLPSALSGGMQQRVGIARALTTDPEILLMDEPFSGLDPLIRREMQDELIELQDKVQKTIVFVTHDLHEALKLGGRIAIMRDGKIIQVGAPEDVITDPADDYVREFVQDASPAKVLTAGGIMEQPEALLYEWQGPKAALHTLRSLKEDHAFMVGRDRKLLGLVTMKRLKGLIQENGSYLKDSMETDIATTGPDVVLEELFPLAAEADYPIAVIDEVGKFIGEIQISSIFENMIQEKTEGNNGRIS
ncbi:MAG: glycine betaine/L-proline ABC transporter ATP-binding protein [Deltaproteobacteria bacterium]|nr:glycine betaine/L-proline ABC transporter ATP-binding protein [Deltaproteobacteria bacterium]MBN2846275.1 glycine betaine/L-proline ABC transporter ATP-binding protein [Deltaproteobacteria bacterium]